MSQDPGKIIYEYSVLRYVPDIEREEFVNVGLMMMSKRCKWLKTEININDKRISALSSKSNLKRLENQLDIFCSRDVPFEGLPVEERYRWMAAVKSAIIQTSQSHPGIIIRKSESIKDDIILLEAKFNELFQRLVLQ